MRITLRFEALDGRLNLPTNYNYTLHGFIYNNYCSPANRLYFSDENGKKIDTIRMEIEKFKYDEDLYYFLLASLIVSADKVANTASVYGAFLKHLKKSAKKKLILEAAYFEENENEHEVLQEDANLLIKKISGDILYLDPPYNHRQYGANYHLLNTIAEYKEFIPKGKTGLREYYKSNYCKKSEVKKGVVRDIGLQQKAIKKIVNFAVEEMGLSLVGVVPSKIKGPKGNQEYLGYFRR